MAQPPPPRQFILLLGCTAVGKSALALPLAERIGADILSIDSMQVYRGMDIGTAKPTPAELARIRHHLIDVAEPTEAYSVARFVADADEAIARVVAEGRHVLALAGTPLYLMGLLYGLFEGPSADAELRARIRHRAAEHGTSALHAELARVDPAAAERIHPNDLRRIERALEVFELTGRPISEQQQQWTGPPRYVYRAIGLRRVREDLHHRINARVKQMIADGLVDEVRRLPTGLSQQAASALGYAEILEYLAGRCTLSDAIEQIKIHTRQLAKHQRTWFRRLPDVTWIDLPADDDPGPRVDALAAMI